MLSGRVDLAGVRIANDDIALKAGDGKAQLRVEHRLDAEGRAVVTATLSDLEVDTQYAVYKRHNGDYIHMADGALEGGTLTTTATVTLDEEGLPSGVEPGDTKLDVDTFTGRIRGARVTVPDDDGEAQVEIGDSRVRGEIHVDGDRIAFKGDLAELDTAIHDLKVSSDATAVDVEYAHVEGSGTVEFDSTRGIALDADVDALDLRAHDIRTGAEGTSLDAGRTLVSGSGKLTFDSEGSFKVDGDVHLDATVDGATILLDGNEATLRSGSRVIGDVRKVEVSKDGSFLVMGEGLKALEGRISLDAIIETSRFDLTRLSNIPGLSLETLEDGYARLRIDVEGAHMPDDGTLKLTGASVGFETELGTLEGTWGSS